MQCVLSSWQSQTLSLWSLVKILAYWQIYVLHIQPARACHILMSLFQLTHVTFEIQFFCTDSFHILQVYATSPTHTALRPFRCALCSAISAGASMFRVCINIYCTTRCNTDCDNTRCNTRCNTCCNTHCSNSDASCPLQYLRAQVWSGYVATYTATHAAPRTATTVMLLLCTIYGRKYVPGYVATCTATHAATHAATHTATQTATTVMRLVLWNICSGKYGLGM